MISNVDWSDIIWQMLSFATYNNKKPWLSDTLRETIKKKNKLYYKSVQIKSLQAEIDYKTYGNELGRLLKTAERKFYNDILYLNKSNSKNIGSIMKKYYK